MYGLDLFTGIGGITLALQDYVSPLAYCEIDSYCQSILLQRMQEGDLPKAPIWDDIRTLQMEEEAKIDIIYGGFPCQDISVAGLQKGLEGERSGLFFEILRILDETKAPFIFLENVPNIRTKGAERVCKELSERGYDCRWCNISAADVGARHKRERWFLLAHAQCKGSGRNGMDEELSVQSKSIQPEDWEAHANDFKSSSEDVSDTKSKRTREMLGGIRERTVSNSEGESAANTCSKGLEGQCKPERVQQTYSNISDLCRWTTKSRICRTSYDVSKELDTIERTTTEKKHRVNRIKAIGNSVVPLQVRTAFEILIKGEYETY